MNFLTNMSFSGEGHCPKLLSIPTRGEAGLEAGVDMDEG